MVRSGHYNLLCRQEHLSESHPVFAYTANFLEYFIWRWFQTKNWFLKFCFKFSSRNRKFSTMHNMWIRVWFRWWHVHHIYTEKSSIKLYFDPILCCPYWQAKIYNDWTLLSKLQLIGWSISGWWNRSIFAEDSCNFIALNNDSARNAFLDHYALDHIPNLYRKPIETLFVVLLIYSISVEK